MYTIEMMRDGGDWRQLFGASCRGEYVREAKLVQSSNSIGSLTLSVLPSFPFLSELACNRRVRAKDEQSGEYVFFGRVIDAAPQMDEDGIVFTEVTCEDALGFLQDTRVWIDSRKSYFEGTNKNYAVEIDEDENRIMSSGDLAKLLVGQHNNTVGDDGGDAWKKLNIGTFDVDADEETTFSAEYEATAYEMLSDVAEDAAFEYRSRYDGTKCYIDMATSLGEEGGAFKLGDNLASAALESSMADVVTRMFPYGDEYAKLEKKVRKGTKVTGGLSGSEWQAKKGMMVRFPCENSLKCVLTVGARNDDYAMVVFASKKLTKSNAAKAVVKKYTTKANTKENLVRRYSVPEDAKFVYVFGADSKCTTYGYYRNGNGDEIHKSFRTDLAFWKKKLTAAQLSKILKKYGCEIGSVVDGSGDESFFLRKNEAKYGVVEGTCIKEKQLATSKITNSKKAVYSLGDLNYKAKTWTRKATKFVTYAARQLSKKCSESVELTVTGYDLREAGLPYDALRLYDTWTVTNELCGINCKAEVVRVERDLLKPWCVEVEMGSKVTRASGSSRSSSLGGTLVEGEGNDDDSAADEYATLVGQYAEAAEEAAESAVVKADELDTLSRRIQVDSLAAGQMASSAYDDVHPITEAMRSALDEAEQQAHELTAVKESQSKTIEASNALARAVATYSYETEKSVVRWQQTYTASLDAWASDDEETQAKIKSAYAKLYGEGGTAENPAADSAQGHLNAAKAANVDATAKEAEMASELASAQAYQQSCNDALTKQTEAYNAAKANYDALKVKTGVSTRQIDAAWTALQTSTARKEAAQEKVDAAAERCAVAEKNYSDAKDALAEAEKKVEAASAEVDTAMDGIHSVYKTTITQTADRISLAAEESAENKENISSLEVAAKGISSRVESVETDKATYSYVDQKAESVTTTIEQKGYQTATQVKSTVTQTLEGWTWEITDIKGLSSYMSFTNVDGTGTLTLGGTSSTIKMGGSKSTIDMSGAATINMGTSSSTINMGGTSSTINMGKIKIDGSGYIYSTASENYCKVEFSKYGLMVRNPQNTDNNNMSNVYCRDIVQYGDLYCCGGGIGTPEHVGPGVFVGPDGDPSTAWLGLMVGKWGSNHGLWSTKANKWLIYSTSAGAITCNGGSSKWIKQNIADVTDEEAKKLLGVRVVTFDYKADDDEPGNKGWIGAIAEEVNGVIPRAVTGKEEYDDVAGMIERGEDTSKLGLDYGTFTPYLIKLCQMQQAQIDALAARVAALETGTTAAAQAGAE